MFRFQELKITTVFIILLQEMKIMVLFIIKISGYRSVIVRRIEQFYATLLEQSPFVRLVSYF